MIRSTLIANFIRHSTGTSSRIQYIVPTNSVIRAMSSGVYTKLERILTDYRKANYTQTLPSRFAKEVVSAADRNGDGAISVEEIQKLLENIGATDQLTHDEIDEILTEVGVTGDKREIPNERVIELLKGAGRT